MVYLCGYNMGDRDLVYINLVDIDINSVSYFTFMSPPICKPSVVDNL